MARVQALGPPGRDGMKDEVMSEGVSPQFSHTQTCGEQNEPPAAVDPAAQ